MTGTVLRFAHSADASCDRAELSLQTNTTRGAAMPGPASCERAEGTSRRYVRRFVRLGPAPFHQPGLLQQPQAISQQVGRHTQQRP